MKGRTLFARLTLAFGALAALILLLGGLALRSVSTLQSEFDLVLNDRMPKVQDVQTLREINYQVGLLMRDLLLAEDGAAAQRVAAEVDERSAQARKLLDGMVARTVVPAGQAALKKVTDARDAYLAERAKYFDALKAGDKALAQRKLAEVDGPYKAYDRALESFIGVGKHLMKVSAANVADVARTAFMMVAAVLLVAMVAAVALAAWIIRSTTGPLRAAVQAAAGVAGGDLMQPIEPRGTRETAQLLASLKAMQGALAQVVTGVRSGADGIATASGQIAAGNADLSSRTEQQASALQQTAASMDELGSTVKGNADTARQANQLAVDACEVAMRGGEAVQEVVQTMKSISDSSRRIADIIGTIDGIAFQTNILALNAAVEAARAGEQGRGFAVVAGEVRSLAQRSALAAKEIKTLINESVERVAHGQGQVDRAGETIVEAVASVRRVTDLMSQISAATGEQSDGVAQVADAVTAMDRATQQNAALVEESAAAAESLKAQADGLVRAVGFFRVAA
jgi:methyl-accepting chemotaxis protein